MLFFAKYLSLHRDIQPFAEYAVTPCMGVWIETRKKWDDYESIVVTPCMGVWIETDHKSVIFKEVKVTPCMGVWIETITSLICGLVIACHTLYGCVD